MNKKYFCGIRTHVFMILFLSFPVMLVVASVTTSEFVYSLTNPVNIYELILWIAAIFLSLACIVIYINFISIHWFVNEDEISVRSFVFPKRTTIKWSEVKLIEEWPPQNPLTLSFNPTHKESERSKLMRRAVFGHTFMIHSKAKNGDRIWIASSVWGYKTLFQAIINKCKYDPDIVIDTNVLAFVNQWDKDNS